MIECRTCRDMGQIQTVNAFLKGALPVPCPKCNTLTRPAIDSNAPKDLKAQALSKLTKEEREALGL